MSLNMLTEQQKQFCELYCVKEAEGLAVIDIAKEIGVSRQTCYTWLKDSDIKAYIRHCTKERACLLLPAVVTTAESGLASKDAKDRLKASELALKVTDRLTDADESDKLNNMVLNKATGLLKVLHTFYEDKLIDSEEYSLFTTLLKGFFAEEIKELTPKERKALDKQIEAELKEIQEDMLQQ